MAKKKNSSGSSSGYVYSTDPTFRLDEREAEEQGSLPAEKQQLRVFLDTRQRAGKAVTLVGGFSGPDKELEELGKKLKSFCGTGGSVKDRQVIIQGDQREKVMQWLMKNGYTKTKRIG